MTVEDPSSRVVGDKSNVDGSSGGNGNGISTNGVGGSFGVRRVESGIVGSDVLSDSNDLELVTVKMDCERKCQSSSLQCGEERAYKDERWRPYESKIRSAKEGWEKERRVSEPVNDLKIDDLTGFENVNSSLRSVDSRVRSVGSHRQLGEERRNMRHLEGDVVERSSVDSIVLCVVRRRQMHVAMKKG